MATHFFKAKGFKMVNKQAVWFSLIASIVFSGMLLADEFPRDVRLNVASAELAPPNMFQPGQNIDRTVDGDAATIFHTPWSGIERRTPVSLTFELDAGVEEVSYIALIPRASGVNGIIRAGTVAVRQAGQDDFTELETFRFPRANQGQYVNFRMPISNPEAIRVTVTDAYSQDDNYYVSLAQFEAYAAVCLDDHPDYELFTDHTFSRLANGVTQNAIDGIQNSVLKDIAQRLLDGTYRRDYRIQDYTAYRDVHRLAGELKMGAYSQFENPTGLYFEPDEDVVVFVGPTHGHDISLRVRDFGQSGDDHSYRLRPGINSLTMRGRGNGYVSYYVDDPDSAPPVTVHIPSGQVNGFFDSNIHTNADGAELLNNAVSPIMDLRGQYVQLAYTVNALTENSPDNLRDLVDIYDTIVRHQYNILGFFKHDRVPQNRMFGRVAWSGYMFRDQLGAGFHENTMGIVAHHENIIQRPWGPAHEFGHINQARPGMMWVGTTEVTNNIYSAYTQYHFTPENLRLEHERVGGTIGGRFNAYLNNAHIHNQEWGLQAGPDRPYGARNGSWGGDHFVKLCPLWQLMLFFHMAGEGNAWHRPYFWGDVYEAVRTRDERGIPHGQLQVDFVKHVCDAVGYDLSEFFIRIGMLQEVDKYFSDYTSHQKTITAEMIQEAVEHASQYPRLPLIDTLHYISGNSYPAYKYQRPLEGVAGGGVSETERGIRVDHAVWKNTVVYETYSGQELTTITMTGTGSPHPRTFTEVPFPEGSTTVLAVGFDGQRMQVYPAEQN